MKKIIAAVNLHKFYWSVGCLMVAMFMFGHKVATWYTLDDWFVWLLGLAAAGSGIPLFFTALKDVYSSVHDIQKDSSTGPILAIPEVDKQVKEQSDHDKSDGRLWGEFLNNFEDDEITSVLMFGLHFEKFSLDHPDFPMRGQDFAHVNTQVNFWAIGKGGTKRFFDKELDDAKNEFISSLFEFHSFYRDWLLSPRPDNQKLMRLKEGFDRNEMKRLVERVCNSHQQVMHLGRDKYPLVSASLKRLIQRNR